MGRIVALEGAPGVGKSTTAGALADRGAFVVPEVNLLFARPSPEPADWYCERQVARWEMAALQARAGRLAVLDGDLLQPVWFSWIYAPEWGDPRVPLAYFRRSLAEGRMRLPDHYVLLWVAEEERRERMLARERARGLGEERAQKKTAAYAAMVEPQRRFFQALGERFPGWVTEVEAVDLAGSVAAVEAVRSGAPAAGAAVEFMAEWICRDRDQSGALSEFHRS
jgi:hypothetical protein